MEQHVNTWLSVKQMVTLSYSYHFSEGFTFFKKDSNCYIIPSCKSLTHTEEKVWKVLPVGKVMLGRRREERGCGGPGVLPITCISLKSKSLQERNVTTRRGSCGLGAALPSSPPSTLQASPAHSADPRGVPFSHGG